MVKNVLNMTDEEKRQFVKNFRKTIRGKENPFKKFRERKQKESEEIKDELKKDNLEK